MNAIKKQINCAQKSVKFVLQKEVILFFLLFAISKFAHSSIQITFLPDSCVDKASVCKFITNKSDCDPETNQLCPKSCEICEDKPSMITVYSE